MKTNKYPVFKPYDQGLGMLFPPSLDDFIEKDSVVRLVSQLIDNIDITPLIRKYPGGGSSSYNPRMLLKVLIFSYLNNVTSSRRMAEKIRKDVEFMWIAGMACPDHNTINRFRGKRLSGILKDIFKRIVLVLIDNDIISLEAVYLDNTKIEANANRYTFVWKKSVEKNKNKLIKELEELWQYYSKICGIEEKEAITEEKIVRMSEEELKGLVTKMSKEIKNDPEAPEEIKKKASRASRIPKKLKEYEKKEEMLDGKNSCSTTDNDAAMMPRKEDSPNTLQLRPCYNVGILTDNQYVVGIDISQKSSDTEVLQPIVERMTEDYEQKPAVLVADAGYGSEENLLFLESKGIKPAVKFNYYNIMQNPKKAKNPFWAMLLHYNEADDFYVCPIGQRMTFRSVQMVVDNGKAHQARVYEAQRCQGCPLLGVCHKPQKEGENRRIFIRENVRRLRAEVMEYLSGEEGGKIYARRSHDVETVFADIKHNMGFRRFILRGKEKVETEMGLVALGHNIKKLHVNKIVLNFKNMVN